MAVRTGGVEGEGATVWAGWGDEGAIDEPRGQELRPGNCGTRDKSFGLGR